MIILVPRTGLEMMNNYKPQKSYISHILSFTNIHIFNIVQIWLNLVK